MRASHRLLFIAAMSLSLLAFGELLKYVAYTNLQRQTSYMDKTRLLLPRTFSASNVDDERIRFLAANKFFKDKVTEDGAVQELKAAIPSIADTYFKSVWDMFRYLEFINDREGIYTATDRLLASGYFRESAKCLDSLTCRIKEATSNITADDGDRLFTIINDNFINPAVQAYEELAFPVAHDLATDAMILTRKVDFDASVSPENYDRVLVIGTFLAQSSALSGNFTAKDLASLIRYFDEGTLTDDEALSPEISAYMIGMGKLRSECFEDAARLFDGLATKLKSGASADLFYFLSIRATAHPFLELKGIQSVGDQLYVKDCGKTRAMSDVVSVFNSRFERAYNAVQHRGLRSDIEFYRTQSPLNEARKSEIEQFILVSAQRTVEATSNVEIDEPARDNGSKSGSEKRKETKVIPPKSDSQDFDRLTDVLLSRPDCATLKSIKKGLINIAYADLNEDCEASDKTKGAISHFLSHYSLVASDLAAVEQKLKDIGAL